MGREKRGKGGRRGEFRMGIRQQTFPPFKVMSSVSSG